MKILLILLLPVVGGLIGCDKFLSKNVGTTGINHTKDTVLFNRAFAFSTNHIHEETTVLATDSIVYFILNGTYTEFHDSSSYRINPIYPYAKGAYQDLYYDHIEDTAYMNTHGLCFVLVRYSTDSIYFRFPLTSPLFH